MSTLKMAIDKWMSWIIQLVYFYISSPRQKKETIGRVYHMKEEKKSISIGTLTRRKQAMMMMTRNFCSPLIVGEEAHTCAWNWIKSCKWRKWYVNFFPLNYPPYACYPSININLIRNGNFWSDWYWLLKNFNFKKVFFCCSTSERIMRLFVINFGWLIK